MAKINREEYEVLKALDDEWKWMARYKNGRLYKFQEKPKKVNSFQWNDRNQTWLGMSADRFQFIQWEDSEPYDIAELIEEYEDSKEYNNRLVIEYFMDKAKESEEKEVKNIEWLKEEVYKIFPSHSEMYGHPDDITELKVNLLNEVINLIDQLDEPEVLSQEFIDEHKRQEGEFFVEYEVVPVRDLQNLLVPKQEEITEEQAWEVLSEAYDIPNKSYIREAMRVVAEHVGEDMTIGELKGKLAKPVIPQFVADWLEEYRDYWELYVSMEEAMNYKRFDGRTRESDAQSEEIKHWLLDADNQELYVRAWLDGFTVEEEPKYIIDTDDIEISDGNHYLTNLTLSRDSVELPIVGYKSDAIRFDDINQAKAIASYVGGRVEELEE